MQIKIQQIPRLTAACLGALLALIVSIMLTLPSSLNMSEQYLTSYGNALAEMAAKQAVDAAFNHDLVRLQVILQDVMANPHTLLATIHDVENNLLVQAGDTPYGASSNAVQFTSAIVLHDSIAGYVTLTINNQIWSFRSTETLFFAIALLLIVVAAWDMIRNQAILFLPSARSSHDSGSASTAEPEDEHELPSDDEFESVFSVIHIKNLNVLKQQLNGQAFRDTIARLEKIIADVMALYGGKKFALIDNYYVLTFKASDSHGEALFRSACSAYLILELAGIIDKIPLDLAALVSAQENDVTPEKLPFAGLIVESSAAQNELINHRTEFMDLGKDDGRQVIAGFKQPFQNLLDGQTKQLLQIL